MVYARLLDQQTVVYSSADTSSQPVVELHCGEELHLGSSFSAAGVKWCKVTLPDGRTGYIAGSTRVKTIASPRAAKAFLLGCGALVVVIIAVAAWAILSDYISNLRSDELSTVGGRNRVHEWLAKDSLMDRLAQGQAPFPQYAPIAGRHSFGPFVVWAFGDDYRDYSDVQVGSGALGFAESVDTWGHTNSVLIVKLTAAGRETRRVSHSSQQNPFPETGPYSDEEIKVYDAEAWLVDKQTRECLGHQTFKPGPDPHSGSVSGLVSNPFVTYYSVNSLRFRAIDHAVEWAKSLP